MTNESDRNVVRGAGAENSGLTRRDILRGGLALAASIGIPSTATRGARFACKQSSFAGRSFRR